MSNPKPFDPGYDYEQDRDICERLIAIADKQETIGDSAICRQACGEIRALRGRIKNMERMIEDLRTELMQEVDI